MVPSTHGSSSNRNQARPLHHAYQAIKWKSSYPDAFAGAIHADGFAARTTVRFVGSVTAAVQSEAASLTALASVGEIAFDTTATLTLRELRSGYLRAVSLLEGAGIEEALVSYSIESEKIGVTLRVDDDVSLPTDYGSPDAIKTMLDTNGVAGATVTAIAGKLLSAESVYGGDTLRDTSDTSD